MSPTALIVIDVQYDFLPGGALAVPRGDEVVGVIAGMIGRFGFNLATQDWHPRDHGSFASRHPGRRPGERIKLFDLEQILWPDHCVQGTRGAAIVEELPAERFDAIFRKGTDPRVDSYSGFFDNGRRGATGLDAWLRKAGVEEIHLAGLATDYCVKFTALDALSLGFRTVVHADAIRAVDLEPGDGERALAALAEAGAILA